MILNGEDIIAEDHLNSKTYHGDSHVVPTGQKRIYVHIENTTGDRNVFLYLYGEDTTLVEAEHTHAVGSLANGAIGNCAGIVGANACGHGHNVSGSTAVTGNVFDSLNDVPQAVQIWIDGVNYTADIGDQNSKGATMYDSLNNDWGIDGTTEWNTGKLDLSDIIDWTAGEHYIEFKCTSVIGGRLLYSLYINVHE
jgi:hypothetical protein